MEKAYVTASKAEQHRQKGDYCKQLAAIALFNGNMQAAENYQNLANAQYSLAAKLAESPTNEAN